MPDYTRLSIWETHPSEMSWYDYAMGRTQPTESRYSAFLQTSINESAKDFDSANLADTDREHSWFYELKQLDEQSEGNDQNDLLKLSGKRAPTPNDPSCSTIHQSRLDPYFEYMFANADSEDLDPTESSEEDREVRYQSPVDIASIREDVVKNNETQVEFGNATLDLPLPMVSEHRILKVQDFPTLTQIASDNEKFFHEQRLIDSYLNGLPSAFSDDSQTESDYSQSPLSYGCFHNVTSPPTFDFYDFKHHKNSENACDDYSHSELQYTKIVTHGKPLATRPTLHPVSPRYTFAKKLLAGLSDRHTNKWFKVNGFDKSSVFETRTVGDEQEQPQQKRLCTRSFCGASRPFSHDYILSPSVLSYPYDRESFRTISKDFFKHKPLPSPPKGFVGQFEGMKIDREMRAVFPFQPHQAFPKIRQPQTFGAKTHPNGTFTHTHFRPDPFGTMSEYNDININPTHPLTTCMSFATDMTISSCHPNMVALRSKEEEILRREAHIECSSARLEGMAVGFWRYLQGSYGLEEYRQANMCICWESCECNKMCTRYADLKCPCSQDIIVHGDD